MTIHDFEHKLLGLIDDMVATATDDELFAGGYLRGHISLAVARAELEGKTLVRDVKSYVLRSLNEAILQGELSEQDEELVQTMWKRLQQQAEA
ncbi:YfcL family protein [Aeromonas enteropelogenes]|uniref:YfcL family protein n=2 Tax=Aeromonas TaxID=642 RepID=A0ABU9J9I3_AEREN|nr:MULTISPECIES: YfcL family protein [Aeromonas]MBL0457242.1 YfcL family protein [Aeromonas enteropelogenes]MBL0521540.1 YfcL family protein [Aeromonas enteropelogenes]MCZ0750519.1 YfcL family protein [Aeromonas enteropelogenes]QXC32734.1 YfcL family protein [Aeromonas sp. FDAARGOS 1407]RQM58592.1 YfcL family protein [Aeromonas enteropelogenes]